LARRRRPEAVLICRANSVFHVSASVCIVGFGQSAGSSAQLDRKPDRAPPFSLLDGVSLSSSAPEPSTWAMLLVGFAGLGYAGFRKRSRSVISAA